MRRDKFLVVLALFMLLGSVWIAPTLAHSAQQSSGGNDVAILVIDVFEENSLIPPVSTATLPNSGLSCAMALGGQDGAAFRGNTEILSKLHPFSAPHGRMVYDQFQWLLDTEFGQGNPNSTTLPTMVENWDTGRGKIWLTAVDTHKYNVSEIAVQTRNAVNMLSLAGVHTFILNMSFALVPCQQFPPLTLRAYKDQLEKWNVNCSESAGLQDLACTIDNSSEETFVDDLIKVRDAGGPKATAFALLHLAVMRSLMVGTLQATTPNPIPKMESNNFLAMLENLPSNNIYVQVASAGNDDLPYPYYPAIADNVLSVKADYMMSSCQQGNQTKIHDFLKSQLSFSEDAATEVAKDLAHPELRASNSGEVKADGNAHFLMEKYLNSPPTNTSLLGCVYGSSFSAPQVAVLMAKDQQIRGTAVCGVDATGNPISPPLGYREWQNLDISSAANQFCPGFPK